jgi:hypothetical protein
MNKIVIQKGTITAETVQARDKPPEPPKKRYVMANAKSQVLPPRKTVVAEAPKPPEPPKKLFTPPTRNPLPQTRNASAQTRNAPPPRSAADRSGRNGAPKKRHPFEDHRQSESKAWVGVLICIGAALLLIGICAAVKASRNTDTYEQVNESESRQNDVVYVKPEKYEPKRYAELNGMTIEEYMKKNNTNNAMLKARLEGIKNARAGKVWSAAANE